MANTLTPEINSLNIFSVRSQIANKNSSEPHYATAANARSILTDFDTFPYPRWFRGDYTSSEPVVAEREAGWRQRADPCYKVNPPPSDEGAYPNHCFEAACSTVYPCYPKHLSKWGDREDLNLMLNKGCLVQYR